MASSSASVKEKQERLAVRDLHALRIAVIAPPGIPCPPQGYGASELVAGNLSSELARRGHDVTLFAHPGSPAAARLISFPEVYAVRSAEQRELAHSSLALDRADEFDVIHNHCIVPGASLVRLSRVPSVTTLHYLRPIVDAFPDEPYIAVSEAQARTLPHLNVVGVAHNGVELDVLPFVDTKSEYLLWLGRIDPKKGPHLAIEAARCLGFPLVLAASHPSKDNRRYFHQLIEPGLGDSIRYVGEVAGREKAELLGGARCVLMPQQWEEPFGLVAAEAMACGTPVVAFRRGALPEVIPHGEAGFIVDTVDEMVDAVRHIREIDAARCRRVVEERFTASTMTDAYLGLYRGLIADRQLAAVAEAV